METKEHKAAGDLVRIETVDNPYTRGSQGLAETPENTLFIRMMRCVDGIPMPLSLELSAGDIVALAGDYYTRAGWGKELVLPPKQTNVVAENRQLFHEPIEEKEQHAFLEAFADLASPLVTPEEVQRIYAIGETTYIPFFPSLNALVQQLVYSFRVRDYGKKLNENEAHFAPWSARAYIVGHNLALQMAHYAYCCEQLANGKDNLALPQALHEAITNARANPEKYQLNEQAHDDKALYQELAHRYHALAIAHDLFAMHFYSDHFAGGHLSRIGRLRQVLPQQFGVWGSILVNNMHNEDNTDSVTVTDPFQPETHAPYTSEDKPFRMIKEDNEAFGDGTYLERENAENSNMLINGMDNSLGDVYLARTKGIIRASQDYGGLAFLPEIDYTKRQTEPLLLQAADGLVYFRKDIRRIQTLSPCEYQNAVNDPTHHGYERLTTWQAFKLVFKLRVLGLFYSPQIVPHSDERERIIQQDESHVTQEFQLGRTIRANITESIQDEQPLGKWRTTTPIVADSKMRLFHRPGIEPPVNTPVSLEDDERYGLTP